MIVLGYIGIALIFVGLIGMFVLCLIAPLREDLGAVDQDLKRRGL